MQYRFLVFSLTGITKFNRAAFHIYDAVKTAVNALSLSEHEP